MARPHMRACLTGKGGALGGGSQEINRTQRREE
jgi:hypothetical protein